MSQRIALAYSGSLASSAAVAWLRETHAAEVATVTLDLGQPDDLDELRARALACGAVRAHVVDAREAFVREAVVPALREVATTGVLRPLERLADPLIARTLLDVATIEAAGAVAHAASGDALEFHVKKQAPGWRVVSPAREWAMDARALADYARARHLPGVPVRRDRHLLLRPALDPARADAGEARLELALEGGVPISINGVTMTPPEVIDSLSLIAGQHGIGFGDTPTAPAAVVLRAVYAAAAGAPDAVVRLTLHRGAVRIAGATALAPTLNHS